MEYTITRRLSRTLNDLSAEFRYTYCDRDFKFALSELKGNSDEGNWYQNLNNLLHMLRECGVDCTHNDQQDYAFYENLVSELIRQGKIVSSETMTQSIMSSCEKLCKKYQEYPTPTAYMQRLVDKLCCSQDPWQKDSLRLRILKQFIKYGNYLTAAEIGKKKPIQIYARIKLGKKTVTDAEVLEQLDDNIFAMIAVPSAQEIELAMQTAAAAARSESSGQALRALILHEEGAELPACFDAQSFETAKELLLHPDAIRQLTGRILIRHAARTLEKEDITEEEARSALGKTVCKAISFSLENGICRAVNITANRNTITTAMKAALKNEPISAASLLNALCRALHKVIRQQNNEDYRLLRISDDLASGQFRTNGATKRNLYLFAIVFHMTYHSPAQKETVDDKLRDVEKNLFTDYYAANVLQYLSDAFQNDRTGGEIIPSGCSINYKNYAEMIHLYYISQDYQRMPADEKLRKAAKMIEDVKVRGKNPEAPDTPDHQNDATRNMKNIVTGQKGFIYCEDIMSLSEEDFRNFIITHYDRRVNIGKADVSPFQINMESRTALEIYQQILEALGGSDAHRYGLDFHEVYYRDWENDTPLDSVDPTFRQLLGYVHDILRSWQENPTKINRTKLLAALYYDFNDRHINDHQVHSFSNHFRLFLKEINPVLEKCNYALLSSKNLLDILIIFSSYIYNNA